MLSIIIVDYFSTQLIRDLLVSIKKYMPEFQPEIIIVSNGSKADDQSTILTEFSSCRWIDMEYNSGFARANNAGIKAASNEFILLLNPDMLATDNSLEKCYEAFAKSTLAACGLQLLNAQGEKQISGADS